MGGMRSGSAHGGAPLQLSLLAPPSPATFLSDASCCYAYRHAVQEQHHAAAGRHRHRRTQQSSPAEASSDGSVGCHRTQFTSKGCACSRLHSRQKLPPPAPLPPSPACCACCACCCCCMNSPRRPGSAAAASPAAAIASSSMGAVAPSAAAASPKMRMALSAQPLAISPALDQSTVKMVR